MDHPTSTPLMSRFDGYSTRALLDTVTGSLKVQKTAKIDEWCAIVAWADANTVDTLEGAATVTDGWLDTGVPVAGPGAPLVSEFALMELVAVLGRSPEGGRVYVGQVVELAWRLQRVFAAVLAGRCEAWKAQRVADLTHALSEGAADYVDRQLAAVVATCTWAQIERLVDEAILRFDPALTEQRRQDAAEGRFFDVDTDHVGPDGLVSVTGVLDAADGLDLDAAVSRRARLLGQLGSADSLDVRRSVAVGELARQDLTLDLEVTDPETGETTKRVPGRKVVLYAHLTDTAIAALASTGLDDGTGALPAEAAVGRLGNTGTPVNPFQIREWITTPGTHVTVKPAIDLAGHVPVDSYEIPDRLREIVRLRSPHCVFPFCGKRAEACDCDHAVEHAHGGPTCPCNLFPLCRGHHRGKTFSDWRYVIIDPGTNLWIAPNGNHFLVDHHGTRALDPPRRLDPDVMDVDHDWETNRLATYRPDPCPGTDKSDDRGSSRPSAPARGRVETHDQPGLFTDPPPE